MSSPLCRACPHSFYKLITKLTGSIHPPTQPLGAPRTLVASAAEQDTAWDLLQAPLCPEGVPSGRAPTSNLRFISGRWASLCPRWQVLELSPVSSRSVPAFFQRVTVPALRPRPPRCALCGGAGELR